MPHQTSPRLARQSLGTIPDAPHFVWWILGFGIEALGLGKQCFLISYYGSFDSECFFSFPFLFGFCIWIFLYLNFFAIPADHITSLGITPMQVMVNERAVRSPRGTFPGPTRVRRYGSWTICTLGSLIYGVIALQS